MRARRIDRDGQDRTASQGAGTGGGFPSVQAGGARLGPVFGMVHEAGVSLIEMFTVVTVIGLVAAVVLPFVGPSVYGSAAKSGAQQLMEALRRARTNSISVAATYQVAIAGSTIAVTCTPDVPLGNICPAGRPPDTSDTVDRVTMSPTVSPVSFGPTGGATVSRVIVRHPGTTDADWEVTVTTPGRIRMCSPTCP